MVNEETRKELFKRAYCSLHLISFAERFRKRNQVQATISPLEKFLPCFFVHHAEILYLLPINLRLNALLEVGTMFARNESGDLKSHTRFLCHLDSAMSALFIRYAPEEEEIITWSIAIVKGVDCDAIVHSGDIV